MRLNGPKLWTVAVFLTALVALAAPAGAQLGLSVAGSRLQVTGVSPGGRVALFGIVRDFSNIAPVVSTRFASAADDDGDGQVSLDLASPPPAQSKFFAVDIRSGEFVGATPAGRTPLMASAAAARSVVSVSARTGRLGVALRLADVVLVRPDVGAWQKVAGDGGAGDEDGIPDGTITLAASSFADPGGSVAAPAGFQRGDVVVAIDTHTGAAYATVIEGAGAAGDGAGK